MNPHFIAAMPSGSEWLIILGIILLLFGGSKLPALARGLGQSIKEFKKASREDAEEEKPKAEEPKKPEPTKANGSH